ncbi:hypothetical protein VYU27_010555, partial [Nannochloropsis oceanica]
MGDALGHSWVGLLLARAIDPALQTPVPLAFTYKLLVFVVPGSGGKNNIVMSLIDVWGLWPALCVCLTMLYFWMYIFDRYYKRRWPRQPRGGSAGGTVREKGAKKYGGEGRGRKGRARLDTEEEEAELELLAIQGDNSPSLLPTTGHDARDLDSFAGFRPFPSLSEASTILSKAHIKQILPCLPERDAVRKWIKVYCMSRDGASLGTLLYK